LKGSSYRPSRDYDRNYSTSSNKDRQSNRINNSNHYPINPWQNAKSIAANISTKEEIQELNNQQNTFINLNSLNQSLSNSPTVNLVFPNQISLTALVDTGASLSFISQSCFDKYFSHLQSLILPNTIHVQVANESELHVSNYVILDFTIGSLHHTFRFLILENLSFDVILGYDYLLSYNGNILISEIEACETTKSFSAARGIFFGPAQKDKSSKLYNEKFDISNLKIQEANLSKKEKEKLTSLCERYHHLFVVDSKRPPSTSSVEHHIELTEKKIVTQAPYRSLCKSGFIS
ncbi:hypothetical protein ROZALSC1DRAFT_25409, partial [Rozella allomycis CSF55]